LCERPGSFAGLVPQARSLILKPPLEFWRPRQEEPFEQAATVEVERAIRIVSVEGLSEGTHIAPKLLFIDTHFLVASAGQHIGVERSSQAVQRLPQRGAGMLLVELRPQESQERVSAVEAVGGSCGEKGQEGDALRLCEDGVELEPVTPPQFKSPEQPKRDHMGLSCPAAFVAAPALPEGAWSRCADAPLTVA